MGYGEIYLYHHVGDPTEGNKTITMYFRTLLRDDPADRDILRLT